MKLLKAVLSVVSVASLSACVEPAQYEWQNQPEATPTATPAPVIPTSLTASPNQEEEAAELGNYVLLQMKIVNARMSDLRKQVLARQIVTVAMEILSNQEQRKQFVTLIAIESKFDAGARSHVGATGLGQVMPAYAAEFAAKCGVKNLDPKDLEVPEINLMVSACRFRNLMDIFKGQISLALVGYNAGASSNQIKQLQELRTLSTTETANYIVRFAFVQERAEIETKKPTKQDKQDN
jgi:hypothetical protein